MAENRIEQADVLEAFRTLRTTLKQALDAADALVTVLETVKAQPMPKVKRGPFAPFTRR